MQQQQQQGHKPSRRTMSVKPIHQSFLAVDGLKWDLSNLASDSPSCQESQQPEDPPSPVGSISTLSHVTDDYGSGMCSFASLPSPSYYPSPSDIPACLDVDDIFDKLRVDSRRGRLANPQLAGLASKRDKPSSLPFRTRMATSSRTSPGVGVEQQPSMRKMPQSPDLFRSNMMQRMERQGESNDPMEDMVRRDESFRRGHHQDEDDHRSRRQQEANQGEDPFQRMEDRSRLRSKQDDDGYHQQSRREDNYHDRSSRRDDSSRRNYDDYDRSNDHNNNRPSSHDRYRRDDDLHRSSFDDHPISSQQQVGRNRRQEDSRYRGTQEDSYDEGGYHQRQEDYHHRGGGSSRDNNNHHSRRPPQEDYNSRRYYNDEQQKDDYSDEDDHQDQTRVEVTPGHFVALRGSAETWASVQSGRVQTATCFICMWRLICIDDADMVMCPGCRSISPVEGGRGGGGLGLGMREEDASTALKRLEGKSRRVGGLYR